jgi:hypothetical protein
MPTNTFQQLLAVAEGRILQGIGESDSDFSLRLYEYEHRRKTEENSMSGPPDKVIVLKRSDSANQEDFAELLSIQYDAGFRLAFVLNNDEVYLYKYPGH